MSIPGYEVVAVEATGPTTIRVSHFDGTIAEHDLTRVITRGGVFAALADEAFFREVRIDHGAVTWPGEIDLAPDSMWDHAHGRCTGCGWTREETRVVALPAAPLRTVAELVAALQELAPDRLVVAPAPHGGYGAIRIDSATLQERRGQPRGEGVYARSGVLSAGDTAVGAEFDGVVISWEDDQAPRRLQEEQ
ncbi:DUF2442 domain-containing protein [Mycolicibacter virginiensis]|uniref:DUF2442 domain-containing protein n=1 Tax=Mycolicibacter virginiensis TaxID=1795032 RepID=UPI001F045EBB|nr:DUF2442 domain-containing protein [Mycolicibacter virginiensis]ULP48010.1 DUF2442 domain-containing protein [Mycolicibacter virginiensis]